MDNHIDISKHLFYSAWILTILQMFKVVSSAFAPQGMLGLLTATDAAFDCALILFGIGIIRLGRSLEKTKFWLITSIFFFLGAITDIVVIILSYSVDELLWNHSPLIFVRLVFLICYIVFLFVGFIFLKFTIDQLVKMKIIKRKGQFYLPAGIAVMSVSYFFSWYRAFIQKTLSILSQNIVLYSFLFAGFFLILGFLGLSSTMKLIQQWSYDKELEDSETDSAKVEDIKDV